MFVMVFGTFDILHKGHLNFFCQARNVAVGLSLRNPGVAKLASRPKLIVVVARDMNVKKLKDHFPKFNEKMRLKNLKKLKIINKAVLGDKLDFFKVIKHEKPDVICLGYDQKMKIAALKNKLRTLGLKTKVHRLKAYKPRVYKSSKLKDKK